MALAVRLQKMLMSVQKEKNVAESVVSETHTGDSVYASLFEKINLNPVSALSALDNPFRSADNATGRITSSIQPAVQCAAAAATEGSCPRQSPCSGNGG